MGAPSAPVWFLKPEAAVIGDGEAILIPAGTIHHEVELAVRIGAHARRVDEAAAARCIDAFTVANDVTARDEQERAKREGLPWTQSKGHDTFLPMGGWVSAQGVNLGNLRLRLAVAGHVRQDASTGDMTLNPAQLVAAASQWTTLRPGDVLLTGTPEGVGPLRDGDEVVAEVVGHAQVRNPVRAL